MGDREVGDGDEPVDERPPVLGFAGRVQVHVGSGDGGGDHGGFLEYVMWRMGGVGVGEGVSGGCAGRLWAQLASLRYNSAVPIAIARTV